MLDAYLDADEIRASTFIRHVEIHDTLGSTNDRAAEFARDSEIQLPVLVAARQQTTGRGRGKNTWQAADGALTFSVLLEPADFGIIVAHWPQLSLATAVAICDALTYELSPLQSRSLGIKWPNDVMLDGAKICGILIESPGGIAPAKDRLIIGIGINVNNTFQDQSASPALAQSTPKLPSAVSLCNITDHSHNLQHLLCETLRALEVRIGQLTTNDTQLPAACWRINFALGSRKSTSSASYLLGMRASSAHNMMQRKHLCLVTSDV